MSSEPNQRPDQISHEDGKAVWRKSRPWQMVSRGREQLPVPDNLPYGQALNVLIKDLRGTGLRFDPSRFYSEETVELHNCVDSLFYRFVEDNEIKIFVYVVVTHFGNTYRELRYDGSGHDVDPGAEDLRRIQILGEM